MIAFEIKAGPGLCITCNNSPTCYYHAQRGPALFCELFDGYAATLPQSSARQTSAPAGSFLRRGAAEAEAYTGLCMNCEHRRTCIRPRPEGGVWHCENYE